MRVWCGIDWAERHHDVALVDQDGQVLARRRIDEGPTGFRMLPEMLAEHREHADEPIPVAIETAKGLIPAALQAAGYQIYPISPLSVSRYRDRYTVSRAKSDPADTVVLANILRTDPGAHRPVPADSELAQAIRVLARAQQDRSGTDNRSKTSSARCYASTTPPSWPPSQTCRLARPAPP